MPEFSLSDKTLIMIIGPTAVGKSTLMNAVINHDDRFARVRSFTTRTARDNDEPGQYIYLTHRQLEAKRATGEIITDVVSPATAEHYGTLSESYSGEYNLLDTFAHSVQDYQKLGFNHTVAISLTTDARLWQRWLKARFPTGGIEMRQRLREAIESIEWSLSQNIDHHWVVNDPHRLDQSVERIIAIARGVGEQSVQPLEANSLLECATYLLSYEQKASSL